MLRSIGEVCDFCEAPRGVRAPRPVLAGWGLGADLHAKALIHLVVAGAMLDAYSQSGGERQMLAIGRALMSRPKLLLLDELSLGLAPLIVQDITRAVAELAARGLTVLLVEQNARAALKISTYGYVLEMGRFVAEGDAERLMNDERLAATHLRSKSDKTILAQ